MNALENRSRTAGWVAGSVEESAMSTLSARTRGGTDSLIRVFDASSLTQAANYLHVEGSQMDKEGPGAASTKLDVAICNLKDILVTIQEVSAEAYC